MVCQVKASPVDQVWWTYVHEEFSFLACELWKILLCMYCDKYK